MLGPGLNTRPGQETAARTALPHVLLLLLLPPRLAAFDRQCANAQPLVLPRGHGAEELGAHGGQVSLVGDLQAVVQRVVAHDAAVAGDEHHAAAAEVEVQKKAQSGRSVTGCCTAVQEAEGRADKGYGHCHDVAMCICNQKGTLAPRICAQLHS